MSHSRYLFSSHDGFGLGHTRRNGVIASTLLATDPTAEAMVVTGLPTRPSWLHQPRLTTVAVPPLVKHSRCGYQSLGMTFEDAVLERALTFSRCIEEFRPHVVVVDRHPYGTAGELRRGLDLARRQGARIVLGLRDVLDEPVIVREELAGAAWVDVAERFDEVFVYGERHFCDHELEYGLPITPRYCGWVTERRQEPTPEPRLLAVAAGGGGDGDAVFRLALGVLELRTDWRAVIAVGPYADRAALARRCEQSPASSRVHMVIETAGCTSLFAGASAVLQMAGYNSTFEALAAGQRPVLQPRRTPRLEQTIRAERLAAIDLADVVGDDMHPETVSELLERPRQMSAERIQRSGVRLDGAERAAAALAELAASVRA